MNPFASNGGIQTIAEGSQPIADVFFVHGLQGDSIRTWNFRPDGQNHRFRLPQGLFPESSARPRSADTPFDHPCTSVREDDNVLTARTNIGRFTFSRSRLGQVVRFNGRDRTSTVIFPGGQPFEAVKKSADGLHQLRKGSYALRLDADRSHLPLTWEVMSLGKALIEPDIEVPPCIRYMNSEDFEELQLRRSYASVVMENFSAVLEARRGTFATIMDDLEVIMIMRRKPIGSKEAANVVISGVQLVIQGALSLNTNAGNNVGSDPRMELFGLADHLYGKHLSDFRRDQDRAANFQALLALMGQNPLLVVLEACFTSLVKANASIIAANALVVPQQWIDIVTMPDVDILIG
ncbi:hypothetical protein FOXG_17247 [Fusarium oxysporum f. sp. lycopersici 4287]|uniref:Uncharacterized protein n=1 Tax=Fusarium oxysporum f. sp. lycopersici (strain 4287 / CBS 123668 / FGSC 9935 / NRRL 34936) TaxID=426428 RepID=A0A0J9WAT1_FUSO4|nr:hypothetical protein FOXG_17247 [Fusarium oxysporum f. sp. lycopersici 4287]EWZ77646.1 hypothetical protein FOWG_17967 [Fusarium oxysporum f. sp. lycopersici MN25]KAJ9413695.1 hypothetical protein QL093DRAFT_2072353 [Fusarium oxysporum]KNB19983.1 hypothetical protein FOXG_17247 [Fusarium oxysporum f. sp. lycopersici 4287]